MRPARRAIPAVVVALAAGAWGSAALAQPPLGNPPEPAGNPTTEPKRLLGKILFWDEQLSTSNTVSCGTCHAPEAGGGDPRRTRHPGSDEVFFTDDDVFASPGLVGSDGDNNFSPSRTFLFASQVTQRSAQSAYMAAYSALNFWDGRAGPAFEDPETGEIVLSSGGALEAQSIQPLLSKVEMAHFGRDPGAVAPRIAGLRPLDLADRLPADLADALADDPGYPVLFERAFGSPDVTLARIAMALAAYERTLVPNQTPWDRHAAGEAGALTPLQLEGLAVFNSAAAKCADCHSGNRFTNNAFHNIGVRPIVEDPGRESATGLVGDRGRFKTPTLRNVGLRGSYFHNGRALTLRETVDFYSRAPGALPRFDENIDPGVLGIVITPAQTDALVDFLAGGLTDPRVAAALPPFDHPRLWSQRDTLAPQTLGGGQPVSGFDEPPLVIAADPALIGGDCRIGLGKAPHGWSATLRVSLSAPVEGVVTGGDALPPVTVSNEGAATARLTVDAARFLPGVPVYVQWELAAAGGGPVAARSGAARIVPFCSRGGCSSPCPADLGSQGGTIGPDGSLDNNDFVAFIDLFFMQSPAADLGRQGGLPGADGALDNNDFVLFIDRFFGGC